MESAESEEGVYAHAIQANEKFYKPLVDKVKEIKETLSGADCSEKAFTDADYSRLSVIVLLQGGRERPSTTGVTYVLPVDGCLDLVFNPSMPERTRIEGKHINFDPTKYDSRFLQDLTERNREFLAEITKKGNFLLSKILIQARAVRRNLKGI